MVLARIPARIRPAIIAGNAPYVESKCATFTIIVSVSEPERETISPVALICLPTTPIRIATPMAMTTQTDATRRETFNFFSSSIAMKRRRICGIPKYPSPHASVDTIFNALYGSALWLAST